MTRGTLTLYCHNKECAWFGFPQDIEYAEFNGNYLDPPELELETDSCPNCGAELREARPYAKAE